MMYLLDTNVLSSTSPTAGFEARIVRNWLSQNERRCFLSVISLAEVSYGIENLERKGANRKAQGLRNWFETVRLRFHNRIIDVDQEISVAAGKLLVQAKFNGGQPSIEDATIAATGVCRELYILTRNEKHFLAMGISCVDPFQRHSMTG